MLPRPKTKANTKKQGEKRDAETSPPKSAKSKAKSSKPEEDTTARALDYDKTTNPKTKKEPEDDHPKARGRPKKSDEEKTTSRDKIPVKKDIPRHKIAHGTKIEKHTFDEWMKTGRGFLVDQIDLRKLSLKKTERIRMGKKDLIAKLLEHDK